MIAILTGEMISPYEVLICISLMISDIEQFSYTCWSFVYILLRNFYSDHLYILKLDYSFLAVEFLSSCIFWLLILCWINSLQIFSPICRLSLHSIDCFLSCAKAS
jgi:hypothetical protein